MKSKYIAAVVSILLAFVFCKAHAEVTVAKMVTINCTYVGGEAEVAANWAQQGGTFESFMQMFDTQPDIPGAKPGVENHLRRMTEHVGRLIFSPQLHDTIMNNTSKEINRRTTATCHGDPAGFFADYF